MINAARARIKEIGGDPNRAAAQVLYELVTEEDEFTDVPDIDTDNYFETLVVSGHDERDTEPDGDCQNVDDEEADQFFHESGGDNA